MCDIETPYTGNLQSGVITLRQVRWLLQIAYISERQNPTGELLLDGWCVSALGTQNRVQYGRSVIHTLEMKVLAHMKETSNIFRILGLGLYTLGVVLGILLIVGMVWADMEATFYNFQKLGDQPLDVTCPVFLTQNEVGIVSIEASNSAEKTINPLVRATFSSRGLFRFEEIRMSIEPGETETLQWNISKDDVALRFFILAKVFILPEYQFSSREGTCGTMLLPFEKGTGMQFFLITLSLSLAGLIGGHLLWRLSNKPLIGRSLEKARAMQFLILIFGVGFLTGYGGNWAIGGFALIIIVIILAAIGYLSSTEK